MCKPMGCGNSSESVSNTRNVSPQLSEDYYSERSGSGRSGSGRTSGYSDSGVSRMTRMSQMTRMNSVRPEHNFFANQITKLKIIQFFKLN